MKLETFESGPVRERIQGIQDDMGSRVTMDLTVERDGDVILSLSDPDRTQDLSIQFCTSRGGTRYPGVATKLREVVSMLQERKGPSISNR